MGSMVCCACVHHILDPVLLICASGDSDGHCGYKCNPEFGDCHNHSSSSSSQVAHSTIKKSSSHRQASKLYSKISGLSTATSISSSKDSISPTKTATASKTSKVSTKTATSSRTSKVSTKTSTSSTKTSRSSVKTSKSQLNSQTSIRKVESCSVESRLHSSKVVMKPTPPRRPTRISSSRLYSSSSARASSILSYSITSSSASLVPISSVLTTSSSRLRSAMSSSLTASQPSVQSSQNLPIASSSSTTLVSSFVSTSLSLPEMSTSFDSSITTSNTDEQLSTSTSSSVLLFSSSTSLELLSSMPQSSSRPSFPVYYSNSSTISSSTLSIDSSSLTSSTDSALSTSSSFSPPMSSVSNNPSSSSLSSSSASSSYYSSSSFSSPLTSSSTSTSDVSSSSSVISSSFSQASSVILTNSSSYETLSSSSIYSTYSVSNSSSYSSTLSASSSLSSISLSSSLNSTISATSSSSSFFNVSSVTTSLVPSASANASIPCYQVPDCSLGYVTWEEVTNSNCPDFYNFCLSDYPGNFVGCGRQKKKRNAVKRQAPNYGYEKEMGAIAHICPAVAPIPPAPSSDCFLNCWGYVAFADVLTQYYQEPDSCFNYEFYCLTDYANSTLSCQATDTDSVLWVCPTIVEQPAPPSAANCVPECQGYVAYTDIVDIDSCYQNFYNCLTDYPDSTLACDTVSSPYTLQYQCTIVQEQPPPGDFCFPKCIGSVALANVTTDNCYQYENFCLSDQANATLSCSTTNSYTLPYICPMVQSQPAAPTSGCYAACSGYVNFTDIIANPSTCPEYELNCLSDYPGSTLACEVGGDTYFTLQYACPNIVEPTLPSPNCTLSCPGEVLFSDVAADPSICFSHDSYCLSDYPGSILSCTYNDTAPYFNFLCPLIVPQPSPPSANCAANCNGYVAFTDILADPSSCTNYDDFCLTDYPNSTLACSTVDALDESNQYGALQYTCPFVVEQTPPPASNCVADCLGYVAFSDVLADPADCYNWENYCLTDYGNATLGCEADDSNYSIFYICPTILPQSAPPSANCSLDCNGYVAYADVLADPLDCYNSEYYCLTDVAQAVLSCTPVATFPSESYEVGYICPFLVPQPGPPSDSCGPNCYGYVSYADATADPSTCYDYEDFCLTDQPNATLGCNSYDSNFVLDYTCLSIVPQSSPPSANCAANCIGYVAYADVLADASTCYSYENFCLSDHLNSTLACNSDGEDYTLSYTCASIISQPAPPSSYCTPNCIGSVAFADVAANPSSCTNYVDYCLSDYQDSTLACNSNGENYNLSYTCASVVPQPAPPSNNCAANCIGSVAFANVAANPSSCGDYVDYCLSDYQYSTLACNLDGDNYVLGYTCPNIIPQSSPPNANCTANCIGYVKYTDVMASTCNDYVDYCLSDNLNSTLACNSNGEDYVLDYTCPSDGD
jgi:hypothetical protein